jgi:hypothetical protein
MSAKMRPFYKLYLAVAIFCGVLISSAAMRGQDASTQPVGFPDDWTHHHVVFSNPGTAGEALAKGEYGKWLKITSDPRYRVQQWKRSLAALIAEMEQWQEQREKEKTKQTLEKDWSMGLGGTANATGTVGTLSSSNVSGSSVVTINSVALDASPPTASTQTGVFSAAPTAYNNPAITITNGSNVLSLKTNATGAYATGTFTQSPMSSSTIGVTSNSVVTNFTTAATASSATGTFTSASPAANAQITIGSGVNTLTLSNGGTAAHVTGTFAGPALTTTSIGITTGAGTLTMTPAGTGATIAGTFSGAALNASSILITSGGNSLTMTPGGTDGTAVGTFSATLTTNITITSGSVVTTITPTGVGTVTFTGEPANNQTTTVGGSKYTWRNSPCSATYEPCVVRSATTATDAQNLDEAISNTCTSTTHCLVAGANASATATYAGSVTTIVNTTASTITFSNTATGATISPASGGITAATTVTCSGSSNAYSGSFVGSATLATEASNLLSLLQGCSSGAGFTAAADGADAVKLTDTAPGALTFTGSGDGTNLTWVNTAGGNGSAPTCSGSAGTFVNSSTAATLASNFNTALNTGSCPASIGYSSSAAGAVVTLTDLTPGNGINTFTGSGGSGYVSWVDSAGTNGSAACTGTAPTFTGNFVNSSNTTTLAGNFNTALNTGTCPTSVGYSTGTSTNTVTVTSTTVGATTFSDSGGASGIFTWGTLTAGTNGSNACTSSTTGTFATSTSTATLASNLASAIGTCNTNYPLVGATAAYTSGNSFTVTETALGAGSFGVANDSGFAWSNVVTGSNGTGPSCTGSGPYTANYNVAQTVAGLAQNLVAAANACTAGADIIATYTSGGSFTLANTTFGSAASTLSPTDSNVSNIFSWTASTAGSNGTATCNGTTGTYAYSSTLSTLATDLNTAISACTASVIGVTSSTSGAPTNGIILTAYTPGTTGASGITLGNASGVYSWTAPTLSGGTDGTQSSTTWTYWSGNNYLSQAQVAANIASTINANTTLKSEVWALSAPSGKVTVYAQAAGTAGDYAVSATAFSALTWSSATLTGSATATMNAAWFPITYFYSFTAGQCDDESPSADFVAFNTGIAGSANQPTIIAYDNLYTGCPTNLVPVPNVYWQYNTGTGETMSTSPVISLDGTQVAFVQNNGTTAELVILKWAENPALVPLTSTSSYVGCTAPCMISIPFGNTYNDTTSSPFYDFNDDVIYVGDAKGYLHKFTNIFNVANGVTEPAEDTTSPWPVVISGSNPIASPIYDYYDNLVFIGPTGSGGGPNFHSVTPAGTVVTMTADLFSTSSTGFTDTPIADPVAGYVYVFTNDDYAGTNAAVFNVPVNFTASTTPAEVHIGQGATAGSLYSGTFDNNYYSNSVPTGNLYVCGRATGSQDSTIWRVPITNSVMGTPVAGPALTTGTTNCSSVSEYYNSSTTTDYIFFSVQNDAVDSAAVPCTGGGGCIISFNVTSASGWGVTTTANSVNAISGGTGGLVIDNAFSSPSGEGNVYFFPLATQACTGGSAPPQGVATSGICGIQVFQSNVAE